MNKNKFIPVANPTVNIEEAKAVFNQVKSGWISMGKKVQEFENKVEKYIKVKNAIAMNNGTSALDALLTALNINEKDEVIIPSLTYISTANVVAYKKAKLVLCDSDPRTFNIDEKSLLKKISRKTKLIIVTDMKGMPVNYDFYKKLSKKLKIPIIADSAESFGAKYKNKMIGTQLLDNFIFQPYIYSNSVNAHPLEIFLVILIAGNSYGIIGMMVAIPAYSVIRVIVKEVRENSKILNDIYKPTE